MVGFAIIRGAFDGIELEGIILGTADDGEHVGTLEGLQVGKADDGDSVGVLVGRNDGADVGDLVGALVPTIGAAELGTREEGFALDGIDDIGVNDGVLVGLSEGTEVVGDLVGGSV